MLKLIIINANKQKKDYQQKHLLYVYVWHDIGFIKHDIAINNV